jgi:peptidoglycan-N-acetylglucosamine deacetylase
MTRILPDGCRGAVSLTFDDGTRTQRELGVAILDEYRLRGTFYVNPRGTTPSAADWREAMAPWAAVARAGHELGNHTLTHPAPRSMHPEPFEPCFETMSLGDIEYEIVEAERRLTELTGIAQRTFAYPYTVDYVGEGPTQQSYAPVVARHFAAARNGQNTLNYFPTCNLHCLWAMVCWRHSAAEMIGWADRAAHSGAWLIYMFHGIGGEHLSVAEADFRDLCAYLARPANGLWVAPVVEVAAAVIRCRPEVRRSNSSP